MRRIRRNPDGCVFVSEDRAGEAVGEDIGSAFQISIIVPPTGRRGIRALAILPGAQQNPARDYPCTGLRS
ncbi:hypothetical protein GCM10009690_30670 [Brevibacterium permense]|uniref:Uncharacterized protein n=1 Tax=Brevibacterium permense TaxID=234834 RepID=A0ABP4LJ83_9MICO